MFFPFILAIHTQYIIYKCFHANFERHDIIGGMSRTSLHQGYPYVSLRTAYFYERRLIINLDDLFKLPDQDTW